MTSDSLEVIAAFVDGERVDAETLKLALGDAAGRDYLADIVSLREALRLPDPAIATIAPASMNARRWLAAAALVVIGAGTGFAIGHRFARTDAGATAAAAPAPTRVIELTPGVNWHETGGGH
jgi:ferric-dicitrate binding protein FerR (iron transport regulator)